MTSRCEACGTDNPFMYPCNQQGCPHQHPETDRYTAYAPCPHCFESSGYEARIIPATWWEPSWAEADPMAPCPYCDGTGMVEADDTRTLDDLENEEWSADFSAWFASICDLASGESPNPIVPAIGVGRDAA